MLMQCAKQGFIYVYICVLAPYKYNLFVLFFLIYISAKTY